MMPPKATVWNREPHTEGKHLVLENYLKAWFPILGMGDSNRRILFVDGFAGPGEYKDGQDGSPVVAMRVLAEHSAKSKIAAEVVFLFIEMDPDRAGHLEGLVDEWRPKLPEATRMHVVEGSFDSSMTDVLDQLHDHGQRMAPAFVMIDPFGVKGMPMDVIRRIMRNPKCEVYVSFMWESMNRFISSPEFEAHLDQLFGTEEWREGMRMGGSEQQRFLHGLYARQLKTAGAKQVVHFHLFDGGRLKYSIFFGTGHTTGSDRMKQAIWKVAPFGDFAFRGGQQDQAVLIGVAQPDLGPLREALQDQFADSGCVSIEEVVDFVQSDRTIFHSGHVKKQVLKPMEREGILEADPGSRKKNFTYPEECRLRFKPRGDS